MKGVMQGGSSGHVLGHHQLLHVEHIVKLWRCASAGQIDPPNTKAGVIGEPPKQGEVTAAVP